MAETRVHDPDEAGTTVLEVTLASAIFLAVLGILFQALLSLTVSNARAQAVADNVDVTRLVAQQVARDIRGANPLLAAEAVTGHSVSANEVILTSGPTAGPQTIVDWQYDPTGHTLARCTRLLAGTAITCQAALKKVNVSSSSAVFRYFCTSGAELNPANANGPSDIAGAGVRVRVTFNAAPNAGPAPVPIQEDAAIRDKPGGTAC